MLITASCAFLVFNVPADIYFLGYVYGAFSEDTIDDQHVETMFYTAATILSYTNNSINFFIYFTCRLSSALSSSSSSS